MIILLIFCITLSDIFNLVSNQQRIKFLSTNCDFLIPISLQLNVKELIYYRNYVSFKNICLKY